MTDTIPLLFALASAATAPAASVSTTASLDATTACLRTTLGGMGRLATINTAGGALLDFQFDTVGADARPATARIRFAIDDLGATRTVAAFASSPSDTPLAGQLLAQSAKTCLPDTGSVQSQ